MFDLELGAIVHMKHTLVVQRKPVTLRADSRRVILKPFIPQSEERVQSILNRVLRLEESQVEAWLQRVIAEFADRHSRFLQVLEENYNRVRHRIPNEKNLSTSRRLLIGAYFTHEYSVESAALFNPSIVPAPDQSGLPAGALRFILSLRATGEGHISSIEFRSGVLDAENNVTFDAVTPFLLMPQVRQNAHIENELAIALLKTHGLSAEIRNLLVSEINSDVTVVDLKTGLRRLVEQGAISPETEQHIAADIDRVLAERFDLSYPEGLPVCERIIFPVTEAERNGIEDARFVAFTDEGGDLTYLATYTAYDGKAITLKLIETRDFLQFRISPFLGPAIKNKGLALFPEKVNGRYAAISRQDGESLFLMYSDSLYYWEKAEIIRVPTHPWEAVQIGNCGSPIRTDEGWLLLTHGVGPLRKYVISAYLLDLKEPSRIIGALDEPILSPTADEREGYVPNVVYSCGGLIHNDDLVLPYAYSDIGSGIATIPLDALLAALTG